jgi:hypothetical protein
MAKHQHSSYGNFLGGDPREFHPDPECSTEEERAAHAEACARWEAAGGDLPPEPNYHRPLADTDGAHVTTVLGNGAGWTTHQRYGLGTQTWDCDGGDDCVDDF